WRKAGYSGGRRLPDERALQQPVRRAREVLARAIWPGQGARAIRPLYRPGKQGAERPDHPESARYSADQLRHARRTAHLPRAGGMETGTQLVIDSSCVPVSAPGAADRVE